MNLVLLDEQESTDHKSFLFGKYKMWTLADIEKAAREGNIKQSFWSDGIIRVFRKVCHFKNLSGFPVEYVVVEFREFILKKKSAVLTPVPSRRPWFSLVPKAGYPMTCQIAQVEALKITSKEVAFDAWYLTNWGGSIEFRKVKDAFTKGYDEPYQRKHYQWNSILEKEEVKGWLFDLPDS